MRKIIYLVSAIFISVMKIDNDWWVPSINVLKREFADMFSKCFIRAT